MASRKSPLRLKEGKSFNKEIEFKGERIALSLSSDLDVILSALGLSLLALEDPRVDAILEQFGVVFYDKHGKRVGAKK